MKSAGWCNGFAASAAALRQREKERARDSLGRFPGLISRCLRSFASSPLLFLLPTARICPRRRRAVATRKNARVRMLPAKKEEGLGRSSECWERHTAKHPAIPSECNMHIPRYITTYKACIGASDSYVWLGLQNLEVGWHHQTCPR